MMMLRKITSLCDARLRKNFTFLTLFSIIVSFVEVASISAIMPFVDIATNFSKIQTVTYYSYFFDLLEFEKEVNFVIFFGLTLFVFYILRGGLNQFFNYKVAEFSEGFHRDIMSRLFAKYLFMPYLSFSQKNSSYLTKVVMSESYYLTLCFNSIFLVVSEVFIVIFIYTIMLLVNWKITLVFTIMVAITLLFVLLFISNKIKKYGIEREEHQKDIYESLSRLFGNFKHLKLQEKSMLNKTLVNFNIDVAKYARVNILNLTLSNSPRLFLETVGFGMATLFIVYLLFITQADVLFILPTLSLFVVALYRLLPSINRIINGVNGFIFYQKSIDLIISELLVETEKFGNQVIEFNNDIVLEDIFFSYKSSSILSEINLTIKQGQKIAFIGKSGSGKTTLCDIIIGVIKPNKGQIYIDGKKLSYENVSHWRSRIGYVPQQTYLIDSSVKDNICMGRRYVKSKLLDALKRAHIFEFLQKEQGVNTLVGENGIKLSGGQKQRIALARAFYDNPEIIILDEATSALDSKTEKKIMDELFQAVKNKTLIIIAHRINTIKNVDCVYEVSNEKIKRTK